MQDTSCEETAVDTALPGSSEAGGGGLPNLASANGKPEISLWRLLAAYTAAFAAMVPLVFWVFWRRGLSLIEWGDGWTQHAKGLAYYGIWLRELFASWAHGNFVFPTFSTSFGYGADMLTTLQYYTIGDPLNLFAVFWQPENIEQLYGGLLIVRYYLAGLAFAYTIRYLRRTETSGIVVAAIIYAFSAWMIIRAPMHPFFANPLILFPLVILGVERAFRERKAGGLVAAVALSAVVSFYFFYMIAIITACYVLVRMIAIGIRASWRESVRSVAIVVGASVAGTLLAGFALAPVVAAFLHSSRTTMPFEIPLLYPNDYYKQFFLQFAAQSPNPGRYAYVYIGPLGVLALAWLFTKFNGHWLERALLVIAGVFFAFPEIGHILNGFGYPTNRWSWAYAFLAAYLVCVFWDEVWDAPSREIRNLVIGTVVYIAAAAFVLHRTNWLRMGFEVVAGFAFIALCLAAVLYSRGTGTRTAAKVALGSVAASAVVLSSFWHFGSVNWFVAQESWKAGIANNDARHVALAARDGEQKPVRFERQSSAVLADNNSVLAGVSSTEFYWSIDQTRAFDLYDSLAINDNISYKREGVDGRAILAALVGVDYHVAPAGAQLPYGHKEVARFDDEHIKTEYVVTQTPFALSLGYTYRQAIAPELWESLSPTQREEAMAHAVLLGGESANGITPAELDDLRARNLPVTVSPGDGVALESKTIETSGEGQSVHLDFQTAGSGEVHLRFKGIDAAVRAGDPVDVYMDVSYECGAEAVGGRMRYLTKEYQWFEGRHDYVVNSRYCEGPVTGATLTFDKPARISFDALEVWHQPLEGFEEAVAELAAEPLENVDFHDIGLSRATSEITGEITVSEPKVLVVTIPKTDGWTAYVDGKQQDILTANIMWMGLELEPGHHDIRLVYRTPGLYEGAAISVVTAAALLAAWFLKRRRATNAVRAKAVAV